MTGVGDDSHGRRPGRPWLVVGLLLAVGATLALVLSDDLRYLRLGIVAALWAALIGAFLAVRARKNAAHSEDAVAEAQAVYELELEREIAARREYELELETETREAAQAQSREELDALRAEVAALRESLQSLFGGEVLLERVALTAQATRMRSLNDEQRLVSAGAETKNGNGKKPAQLLGPKKPADSPERPTEFMDRVLDATSAERRRAPVNGGSNGTAKTKGANGTSGANGSISAGLNGSGPNGDRSTQLRTQQMPRLKPKRPEPPAEPEPFEDEVEADSPAPRGGRDSRASLADAFVPRGGRGDSGPHEGRASVADAFASREPRNGAPEPHAERPARGGAPEPQAERGPRGGAAKPRADRAPQPYETERNSGSHVIPEPFEEDSVERGPRNATEPLPREAREPRGSFNQGKPSPRAARPQNDAPEPPRRPAADAQPTRNVAPVSKPEPPEPPVKSERPAPRLAARPAPKRPDSAEQTAISRPAEPAAHRHAEPAPKKAVPEKETAVESQTRAPSRLEQFSRSDLSPLAEDTPTGRHGAPGSEGVNPTLPESVRSTVSSGTGGRRRRPDAESSPAPSSGGRRRRPEGEPPAWEAADSVEDEAGHGRRSASASASADRAESSAGHHASGLSVTELLAANGKSEASPRRRRRAED
ncbi:DUF6779 domain-containing protein [Amycolatopsis echigonensis]|uniref:DUF6779 domain-containing protein n=1 Tax=Amycolatopsis echigonensis TaxID=2576905 RepID=A0A2N3WI59_9PSEU|nr:MULTISPECIES: DUF6779 domain-containing protein [Amycolatopsis]MBB2506172.1 hypothetical protein [Amycolatopsis echigonensis]PKV93544.1 hypothetical protein ATK30_4395 [Amycolatopsis niigatensis]